ncbi:hypothetical protein H257_18036 [Aphanomyces astaci]|uniref:subtilisin n=1 Tax=Aphanomyces astaci TaxID=112090 RepID=W4FEN0_APHAT|nr:hypothetical protein H257_18036 [Aphanomyces astaci]ETV65173.1 hypothetical protein H257_18036 [Aphanomyces astaci]|eukprot:XP_009845347.1 hypothetical protein H257_18036 [Aphanomyces astaci]
MSRVPPFVLTADVIAVPCTGSIPRNAPHFSTPPRIRSLRLPHFAFVVRKSRQDDAMDFLEERTRQKKRRAVRMLVKISWRGQRPRNQPQPLPFSVVCKLEIHSGVHHTHESLKSNWRSEYGWFDPYNKTNQLPSDTGGHGTHVMGIMVGTKGIGVAPKAKLIACKGCEDGCNQRKVVECGQFLLCPHNNDGNKCDPSKAPHVINLSLGLYSANLYLDELIKKWRAAGIIPVLSNGNDGRKGCWHSGYPGISPQVISVGNTDANDFLSFDSSLGPSFVNDKLVKPDISAPGKRIRSVVHSSNDGITWKTGSSMATPHVSGAIALHLSANKGASYEQVYRALTESVDTDTLTPPNKTCSGIPNTQYPNNLFGHGRLNIFNAVAASIRGLTLAPPSESTQVLNPTDDLSTCGTLEDNTHYVGGDLASVNLATAESCCAECKKTPGCKVFVWYSLNGGLCRLKDTQGRKVAVDGAKASVLPAPASG